ncbi:hypothetical protein CFC21_053956 [Triticum aestivum]|uniref:Bowman-Birk serine protease inhibitors family domain-containing protein n=2 Tax=Triticum aestivum TaxID=4565 RepID=A0A9R1K8H2_WHEAT|nr:hypothetical protein CFC21_053956 [Triticum aestivum]
MKGSSLVFMVALLSIGYLAAAGRCHLVEERSHGDGAGNASANAPALGSSLDESQVITKFCLVRDCKTKEVLWTEPCFCCLVLPELPCWRERSECQAKCPACNPKC